MRISEHGAQGLHYTGYVCSLETENIDLRLLKACRSCETVTEQAEHCTASTDHQCEFLDGYVTVQHRSFQKTELLLRNLASRNSSLDPRVSKLKA